MGATGNVGSSTAFSLTEQRLADELVLIDDPRPDVLVVAIGSCAAPGLIVDAIAAGARVGHQI